MNVLTELFRGDFKVASWRKAQPPWQARDEKRVMGAARIYTIWNPSHLVPLLYAAPGASMENSTKVLIVEDEPNALMGLAELISGWGYRTETA
jgi:hypothetical protein